MSMYKVLAVKLQIFSLKAASTGSFEWDAKQQGLILGSFYYGYVVSLLPGTFLAEKFGGKWILAIGIFGGSLCSLFSPLVAQFLGFEYFVALRIFQGLLQVSKNLFNSAKKNGNFIR